MRITTLFILIATLIFNAACEKRSQVSGVANQTINNIGESKNRADLIDLNSATVKDLESLPGVGPGLAARIVEHRETYGKFKKPEHLMLVQGIGDKRFRKLRSMIKAD